MSRDIIFSDLKNQSIKMRFAKAGAMY